MKYKWGGFEVDTSDIRNKFDKVKKSLSDPSGVFNQTLSDMSKRAPGKVADAVREVYSIKKADIIPSKKKQANSKSGLKPLKKAGKISMSGETVETLELHYEGRVLSPLHFNFRPKINKKNGKLKKLNLKVRKIASTKKRTDNEPKIPFVAPANKGSLRIIPWNRYPDKNNEVLPMKTLSLPQMVDNEQAREIMNKSLGELLDKRFNHNLKRYLKEAVK